MRPIPQAFWPSMTDEPRAEIAQAALDRHDWRQAYDALAAADERGELSPS